MPVNSAWRGLVCNGMALMTRIVERCLFAFQKSQAKNLITIQIAR